jgi:hypothetical protein
MEKVKSYVVTHREGVMWLIHPYRIVRVATAAEVSRMCNLQDLHERQEMDKKSFSRVKIMVDEMTRCP